MSAILLQDEVVHYEVLGRGRPLIFLHGWVGSWRYWIPAMQAASVSFRTYALDFWGFGDSAKNPLTYTLEQQINLLEQFLQEMGIGRAALIGHGLGAVIAILFTHRFPRLVDRAMAAAFPRSYPQVNSRLLTDSPAILADWLLGRAPMSESARMDAPKADQEAIRISLANLQYIDLAKITQELVSPCLFVQGLNDPAIPISPAEPAANLPEQSHQIVFEGSGHFPMLDEAVRFNRLMVDFLSLNPGESPRRLQLKEEWKRRVR
jgi:pimeloyl-ACP methyl ester carboxylesterase